jgi:ATP-dependent Lon protease
VNRIVEKYLLIPLEDTVVFPGMTVTLPVDVGSETQVLLVPRHESVYAKVGTVAEVVETASLAAPGSSL